MADKNYKHRKMEPMKTKIHELRTRIDGLSQLINSLSNPALIISQDYNPQNWSVEEMTDQLRETGKIVLMNQQSPIQVVGRLNFLAESYKSLLLSKAWLGKVLAELGEETPYKNDGNRKTVEDIEPTSDRFKVHELIDCGLGFDWNEASYIEKIDWLREKIKKLKVDFNDFVCDIEFADYDENFDLAQNHLSEARFHLGFELSRIKEQSK